MHVVAVLEKELGRAAIKEMLPMQPGDVPETFADVDDLDARRRLPAGDADRGRYRAISSRGIATTTRSDDDEDG